MEAVSTVKELHQRLAEGVPAKIKLPGSGRMKTAIAEADVAEKLGAGIQLIPRGITKIHLAATCEIGTIVAKAPFEGYAIGLKRKGDDLFLYFSQRDPDAAKAHPPPES